MRHAATVPRKRQRGVAAVEFGILIIPLVLMLFGLTEYGRAIFQYNTLVKATRDATRFLSTVAPGKGQDEARCLAVYGNTSCSGSSLVPDLAPGMVIICDASNSGPGGIPDCPQSLAAVPTGQGSINLVTVTITHYQFHSLIYFPIGGLTIGAPKLLTFDDISNTMRQAL